MLLDLTKIPNSIINPNSTVYSDSTAPYPYITFASFTNTIDTQEILNEYNDYVQQWSSVKHKHTSQDTFKKYIHSKYIELLHEITLNYTSNDDKHFLQNIILDSAEGHDILIPFFIEKINDITSYFTNKRELLKFTVQKNKNSNSKAGIIANVQNFIINQLLNSEIYNDISEYTRLMVYKNLEIDIIEKYDTFSHNFNVDPNTTAKDYDVKSNLYKKYFNNNILDYTKLSFIDTNNYIREAIKAYPLFIKELGFSFSVIPDLTDKSNLKPRDFVDYNKESPTNVDTFNELTKKYAGVDMYYVSANNNTHTVSTLYTASQSYANKLNIHHITIPTIPAENNVTVLDVGTFFIPTHQTISFYNTYNAQYIHNPSLPNGIYYYPDPAVCGNIYGTSLTQQTKYPLLWASNIYGCIYDNYINKHICGMINDTNYDDFYGYNTQSHTQQLMDNFESLINKGNAYAYKTDIFNNEYIIFKQQSKIAPGLNDESYVYSNLTFNPETSGTPILTSNTAHSNIITKRNSECTCYIKYESDSSIDNLLNVLQQLYSSDSDVVSSDSDVVSSNIDFTNVVDIDIIHDVIILHINSDDETKVICVKIVLNDQGKLMRPTISPIILSNESVFNTSKKLSSLVDAGVLSSYSILHSYHYYLEKQHSIIIAEMYYINDLDLNLGDKELNKEDLICIPKEKWVNENGVHDAIAPVIYNIDINTLNVTILYNGIYDKYLYNINTLFNFIVDKNITDYIIKKDKPLLAYNSLNNTYSLTHTFLNYAGFTYTYNTIFYMNSNKLSLLSNNLHIPHVKEDINAI